MTLITLLACKGPGHDSGWEETETDEPVDETCANDEACASFEVCDDETCVTGDRNNGPDEASPLLWNTPEAAVLQQTGDTDFFSFTAEGGEYLRLHTLWTGSDDEDDASINTLVTLYDPAGKVHAIEDEHAIGNVNTYDTVMYVYLPDAGTWVVKVEDREGRGDTGGDYEIEIRETTAHTAEADSLADPKYDLAPTANSIFAIGVVLEEDGDHDYVALELPYDECPIQIWGTTAETSSQMRPVVDLYVPDDPDRYLHKVDPGPQGSGLYIELDGQGALLDIYDEDEGGGADFWTFVYVRVYDRGSAYEEEVEDNDDSSFANQLAVDWSEGDGYGRGRGWGVMDYEGDEDWFFVEVDDQNYLLVDGTADSLGSSIDGGVEVYDSNGELLSTGEPDEDEFDDTPEWLGPLDEGIYFVRVFAQNDDAAGPGFYYRFTAYQTDSP